MISEMQRERHREYMKEWREINIEKIRLYHRKYMKRWRKENPEKTKEISEKWRRNNQERVKAKNILNKAIFEGKISKPKVCSKCGKKGLIHGHHTDYSQPLSVQWLCPPCHLNIHRSINNET